MAVAQNEDVERPFAGGVRQDLGGGREALSVLQRRSLYGTARLHQERRRKNRADQASLAGPDGGVAVADGPATAARASSMSARSCSSSGRASTR